MKWLGLILKCVPERFNPWGISVPAKPEAEHASARNNSVPFPLKMDIDANMTDSPPRNADGAAAISTALPKDDEDEWGGCLGIGACTIIPWQAGEGEDEHMPNRKTICVSERDIRLVRELVGAALNTCSGVTLEYARVLSSELSQATVLPPSRLPPDVVTLHSRVWATDMENGDSMVVTLVMPHQTGDRADHISILSPLGMALFGYEAGDRIDWGPVCRPIRVRVDRVRRTRSQRVRHPSGTGSPTTWR